MMPPQMTPFLPNRTNSFLTTLQIAQLSLVMGHQELDILQLMHHSTPISKSTLSPSDINNKFSYQSNSNSNSPPLLIVRGTSKQ